MRLELRVPIDDVLPTLVAQHDHSSVRISDARGQGDRAEIVGSRPVIPAKWPSWSHPGHGAARFRSTEPLSTRFPAEGRGFETRRPLQATVGDVVNCLQPARIRRKLRSSRGPERFAPRSGGWPRPVDRVWRESHPDRRRSLGRFDRPRGAAVLGGVVVAGELHARPAEKATTCSAAARRRPPDPWSGADHVAGGRGNDSLKRGRGGRPCRPEPARQETHMSGFPGSSLAVRYSFSATRRKSAA
jgi:hypothetical protein